jgi:hypothetical protein
MMLAAGAEIPYVMAQVGHGDSKVTLEIYALRGRTRPDPGPVMGTWRNKGTGA